MEPGWRESPLILPGAFPLLSEKRSAVDGEQDCRRSGAYRVRGGAAEL
jgi:hypothetical protein